MSNPQPITRIIKRQIESLLIRQSTPFSGVIFPIRHKCLVMLYHQTGYDVDRLVPQVGEIRDLELSFTEGDIVKTTRGFDGKFKKIFYLMHN